MSQLINHPQNTEFIFMESASKGSQWTLLDMNGYQWTVIFAAWLGWGFDVFEDGTADSLLDNLGGRGC